MTRWLRGLGDRCAAHPLVVVAVWLAVAAITTGLALSVGGSYSSKSTLPGTQVQTAEQLLAEHMPAAGHESADVLLTGSPAAVAASLPAVQVKIATLPHVDRLASPPPRWSADRRTAWLPAVYDADRYSLGQRDLSLLRRAVQSAPDVRAYVTGSLLRDASAPSTGLGEKIGVAVAVIVLLLAFGSVIASLMPLASAAIAIVTGLGLVKLLANAYGFNDTAPELATMMGLGVGIDYALFIVTRHREGLRSGLPARTAASASTASAGSSVLWAGITVVAAICGLAFAGIPVVTSLGLAAAVVVACSVAAALTLLPALLSLTGGYIDRLHIPLPHLRHERVDHRLDPSAPVLKGAAPPTAWTKWAGLIERHPWPFVVGPAALLLVLAVPVSGMRLGEPDASSASHDSQAYRSFTLMSREFGVGANAPLTVVVDSPIPAALGPMFRNVVSRDRDVFSIAPMVVSPDGRLGVISVQPRTGPQAAATADLVGRLRNRLLPAVLRASGPAAHGTRLLVTGFAPARYDVGNRVLARLPWFVGAVLAVSFLLLMVVFRSVLVPLKAVLLNLLSIAAALGVTVAVFTWGWMRDAVGVSAPVPLEDVVPMLMFAIVFGLSMDYEVFLLSRVREEWMLGGDGRGSVTRGLVATARVISAAAAIMVSVFLSFTLASDVVVKMIGFGLAVAVFLDATVIRLVLVPATMSLLGERNWWLPRWLDRVLPHIDVEGAVPVTPYRQETDVPMARPTA
jgi:RND superfamily putative drug exporter